MIEKQIALQTTSLIANLRSYDLKPEKQQDFPGFYEMIIKPWLIGWGVQQAKAWIIARNGSVQLFVSCSPVDPPWDDIPGLGEFIIGTEVQVQQRPDLSFP